MSIATWPYVQIEDDGTAIIVGSRTKVIEIALDRLTHHWDADEIHRQHPHLSLAQIHSALSYYYDHQQDCDEQIRQRYVGAEELSQKLIDLGLQAKLRDAASK